MIPYHSCYDCGYVNKSIKSYDGVNSKYRYKCISNGWTCGSVKKDSEFKNCGCSGWIKIGFKHEQLTLF